MVIFHGRVRPYRKDRPNSTRPFDSETKPEARTKTLAGHYLAFIYKCGRLIYFMAMTDTPRGALWFWVMAALTSSERVLASGDFSPWSSAPSTDPRSSFTKAHDAALMLLALRNVLRAAEWLAHELSHQADDARWWIDEFNRNIPDLINARDALEHFDDYAVGRGRLQRSQPGPCSFSFSADGTEPVVHVGQFRIKVRRASSACRELLIELMAAHEIEQGGD